MEPRALAETNLRPWVSRAVALCGLLVVALGFIVLTGWQLHLPSIVRLHPGSPPMQYLTAIGFFFGGLALIAIALRRTPKLALAAALIPALIGLVNGLHYLAGFDTGLEAIVRILPSLPDAPPSLPSPPTTFCFFLIGLSLLLEICPIRPTCQKVSTWILCPVTLSVAGMAIFGYATGLSGTYVWGPFVGMAFHTAVGMLLLSGGLLFYRGAHRAALLDGFWPAAAAGIAVGTSTIMLWIALNAEQQITFQAKLALIAGDVRENAAIQLEGPLRALNRMKLRWQKHGGTPREEWEADAKAYLADEPVFAAIEWVDPQLIVRWCVPEEQAPSIAGLDLRRDRRWDAVGALAKSQAEGGPVFSPVLPLKQGGNGFLVYLPLQASQGFDGFLVGVFDVQKIMNSVLDSNSFDQVAVSIYDGKKLLSGPPVASPRAPSHYVVSELAAHGYRWTIFVAPSAQFVAENQNRLPYLVLVLGILLAIKTAAVVRSWQRAKVQAHFAARANLALKREIRQRRKAETKLRDSEELLRAVLDSATGVSVISADPHGLITYFSKGSERMLGYRPDELVGRCTPALIHDPAEMEQRARDLSAELGVPISGFEAFVARPKQYGSESREWTYIAKDGCRKTVDLTVTVLRNGPGEPTGFLGTAVDVTERRRMEEDLRATVQAMETAQSLLNAAGRIARLGHWELALDGSPPRWSDITYAIHEVSPGTPVSLEEAINFFHPEDRQMVRDSATRSAESGVEFEFEARIITAKGRLTWIHSRGEAVRDEAGRVVALRGVFQDVDERHKAAQLLAERNDQLQAANRQVLAYAQAKAEFLANMSHEIRTPLNAIIGMSELLNDFAIDGRHRELVETIRTSGDVLLALINDILDFSKMESGQLELEHVPVDLHECVESALDIISATAAKKKIDLLYWIDPTVPAFVLGDLTRLRQLLVNLVSNAVKFTDDGEVFVRVSKRDGEGGPLLHVSVRDTGIGIPSDRRNRLFQAFSQVDASTTRRYGGTGLGLAICHRLVEIMKGHIWVESAEGKGSDFQFSIPLEAASITTPTIYQRGANHDLDGLLALLVDDNETNRWILRSQVNAWGMQSRETAFPEEALRWAQRGDPFDVVILDGQMPAMNGYELSTHLRACPQMRQVPIVLLTSMADERKNLADFGIDAVLTKPVKTAPLFETLSKLVLGKGGISSGNNREPLNNLAAECPLRILVAEDNSINQRVISLQMERLGYRPKIVRDGVEALEILKERGFDLIFLDVQMPRMDGYAAAREICRRYPRADRPRIIALTADASADDREKCLAAGMDDFLAKPIRGQNLAAALRETYRLLRNFPAENF